MRFARHLSFVALMLACGHTAFAQTAANGSIRGYVRDAQDAVLPGTTVKAVSLLVPTTFSTVSDEEGYYRLLDLPPGEYTVTAELQGFATFARPGIAVRAGLNLGVDILMSVGSVTEAVQVKADSPLIESKTAVTAMNVSGDFQRELPLSARRHWSDFLTLAPGVVNINTVGSSPTAFYVNGAHFGSHVIQIDGADIAGPGQSSNLYVVMSSDVLQDVQVKTAAIDAASPLGQGAVINMVTKSGTNTVSGSGLLTYQNRSWHGNNAGTGTTSSFSLVQPEATLGGPLRRDRLWVFGAYRHLDIVNGIDRTAAQLAALKAVLPQFVPFDNDTDGTQTLWKITALAGVNHRFQLLHQFGHDTNWTVSPIDTVKARRATLGGHAASVAVASTWGRSFTSRLGFTFGNQTNFDTLSITDRPSRPVFQNVLLSSGRLTGTGQFAVLDNASGGVSQDAFARKLTATIDVSYFRQGWLGSHEWQAGLYLQPQRRTDFILHYTNDGFAIEDLVLRDPSSPAGGTVPFHRRVYSQATFTGRSIHTSNYAGYVQDSWMPTHRLTLGIGLRVDKISRRDRVLGLALQDTTEFGPRVGATYMLTSNGANAIRASWSRLHDAVSAGGGVTVASIVSPELTDLYDVDRDGTFESRFVTPQVTPQLSSLIVDLEGYRQPHANEATVGYTRQFPGQLVIDASLVYREFRDRQARVEVNGVYTDGLFRGFRDQSFTQVYQLTSNTFNWPVYTALELRVSKRSARAQLIGSYTRQFRHIAGTWQPNDPAAFVQPDAFDNDKGIGRLLDGITQDSLSGTDMTFSDQWKDHVLRVAGSFRAPWEVLVATSYTLQSGPWSGPIVTRLSAADPRFGPPTVTLPNGNTASNPLATVIRFGYPNRGEGQLRLAPAHTWNLRIGRRFTWRRVAVEPAVDVLNVTNNAAFFTFLGGANQQYNANYGLGSSRQSPRQVQASLRMNF